MKTKTKSKVTVTVPIEIERGEHGLVYVTSPLIRGLLIGHDSEQSALDAIQDTLDRMSHAAGH